MHINIQLSHLKAAAHGAAKNDIRGYLNGVCIQATATETRYIGTDGHALVAVRHGASNDVPGRVEIVIPRDVIDAIKASKRDLSQRWILDEAGGAEMYKLVSPSGVIRPFAAPAGRFPDYTRVIPETLTGEAGQLSAALTARVQKAADTLIGKAAYLYTTYNGAAGAALIVTTHPDFVAVVMPTRPPKDYAPPASAWARAVPA
ncbi:hypothetical protein [Bordetella bronchiseptica]|uniref:hypothetical protein n=1 Tax=Bordetella bronchiseptica TaxID=518 RepID=UPI000460AEB5|nr:hypothetical protein [Bordetella bronchiseptica]KDD18748.1 DNA polymerase III beta subunit, central-like domain protein [Bordetella bronchiseptica MBORD707]